MAKDKETKEKKNKDKKPRITWNKKSIRYGSYSFAWTAIIIAIIIVINLIVNALPSSITSIDMTSNAIYSLTSTSKEFLKTVDEDITIYLMTESGDTDTMVSKLLDEYESYCSNITVEEVDIVVNPNFTSSYTSDTMDAGSVIIEVGDASISLTNDELYEYETYSYYGIYSYSYAVGFDAEGQITSAIYSLTTGGSATIYVVTGHGESEISDTLTSQLTKENISLESLTILTEGSIPDDADAIIINAPTYDISEAEAEIILEYLQGGGNALIIGMYTGEEFENLATVLEYYGVTTGSGLIFEGNSQYYYYGYPYFLLPEIEDTDITATLVDESRYVLAAYAQYIETLDDIRDTITITELLTTTSSSYEKTDISNISTLEKEDGDESGPFAIAVLIEDSVEVTDEDTAEEEETEAETEEETEEETTEAETEEETTEEETTAEETTEAETTAEETEEETTAEEAEAAADEEEAEADEEEAEADDAEAEEAEETTAEETEEETTAEETTEAETEAEETEAETEEETTEAETEEETTAEETEEETDDDDDEEEEEEEEAETIETKIIYITSGYIADETFNEVVSDGNYDFLASCISSLVDHETSVAIAAKSLEVEYLTMSSASASMCSLLVTVIIPAIFVIIGVVIWIRRRKR